MEKTNDKVVKISKDGSAIDFVQSDKIPVSLKKFRQSPELEGFYRFIFENDLRKEALQVIDRIYLARKAAKLKKPLAQLLAERKAALDKKAVVEAEVEITAVEIKKTKVEITKKATAEKTVAPKAAAAKPAKVAAKPVAKVAAKAKPAVKAKAPAKKAKSAPKAKAKKK